MGSVDVEIRVTRRERFHDVHMRHLIAVGDGRGERLELGVDMPHFQERKEKNPRAALADLGVGIGLFGEAVTLVRAAERREPAVRLVIQMHRQCRLFQIGGAFRPPPRLPRRLDRGNQKAEQNRDDRNHHEKLNEGKTGFPIRSSSHRETCCLFRNCMNCRDSHRD